LIEIEPKLNKTFNGINKEKYLNMYNIIKLLMIINSHGVISNLLVPKELVQDIVHMRGLPLGNLEIMTN
jgi:hypothetical protein